MNLPAALRVIRWLVWETFRQSMASGLFWLMLGVSLLAVVFCLGTATVDLPLRPTGEAGERLPGPAVPKDRADSAAASGVDVIEGRLTFLFGAITVPQQTHYREDVCAGCNWSSRPGRRHLRPALRADVDGRVPADVPRAGCGHGAARQAGPRWSLLAGKYLGVVCFVAFQAGVFVAGTLVALGPKPGVWSPYYLLCIPLVALHFAIFFSFSVFLAVWTRSAIACVFGSLLFWFLCWGMNFGRHASASPRPTPPRCPPATPARSNWAMGSSPSLSTWDTSWRRRCGPASSSPSTRNSGP